MREGLRAHNAVALPDGLYIIGGYNGKEYLNSVQKKEAFSIKITLQSYRYDLSNKKWT